MLFRWIILILLGFFIYRFVRRLFASPKLPKQDPPREIQDEMVQDPVCKVYVPKRQAVVLHDPQRGAQFFCSNTCRDKYLRKDFQ